MDTITLVLAAVTAAAVLIAVLAVAWARKLGKSVDLALARIGGKPSRRWWRRAGTLDREVRELEDQVEASERDRARLAAAVAESPIGILLTDDAGVVVFANETVTGLFGARHGETVAEAGVQQAIESAVLNRRPEHREFEIHTPHRRYLDVRAIPLEHGVESFGCVAYVRDVTEPRRLEVMRSDFVANAAHELKTPLGALAALAGTLAAESGDPVAGAALADRVAGESRRLAKVIGDLLDLSQAEAADRARSPVDLGAVVGDIAAEFQPDADERGVEIRVAPFSPGAVVWGERRQLQTMISNLVENAIKYTPDQGSAERTPPISVSARVSKKEVVVAIEDEGIGIAEEHLDRIFERFYRVEAGRTGDRGGTGLGLSVARRIARNHGGDVSVESQVGVGTTFKVRLPVWKQP